MQKRSTMSQDYFGEKYHWRIKPTYYLREDKKGNLLVTSS